VLADVPAFSRVRNVGYMEHESDELMLIFVFTHVKIFRKHVALQIT
jgi:hypothetical protein